MSEKRWEGKDVSSLGREEGENTGKREKRRNSGRNILARIHPLFQLPESLLLFPLSSSLSEASVLIRGSSEERKVFLIHFYIKAGYCLLREKTRDRSDLTNHCGFQRTWEPIIIPFSSTLWFTRLEARDVSQMPFTFFPHALPAVFVTTKEIMPLLVALKDDIIKLKKGRKCLKMSCKSCHKLRNDCKTHWQ